MILQLWIYINGFMWWLISHHHDYSYHYCHNIITLHSYHLSLPILFLFFLWLGQLWRCTMIYAVGDDLTFELHLVANWPCTSSRVCKDNLFAGNNYVHLVGHWKPLVKHVVNYDVLQFVFTMTTWPKNAYQKPWNIRQSYTGECWSNVEKHVS